MSPIVTVFFALTLVCFVLVVLALVAAPLRAATWMVMALLGLAMIFADIAFLASDPVVVEETLMLGIQGLAGLAFLGLGLKWGFNDWRERRG